MSVGGKAQVEHNTHTHTCERFGIFRIDSQPACVQPPRDTKNARRVVSYLC